MSDKRERRVKIIHLPVEAVLDCLYPGPVRWDFICHQRMPALPEGYEVETVAANWMNKTIDVIVSHPSFDLVPDGGMPPELLGLQSVERFVAARIENDADVPVYRMTEK